MVELKKRASTTRRSREEVGAVCDKCVRGLPRVMMGVQQYLRGCFMKRIHRVYDHEEITHYPSGTILLEYRHPDDAGGMDVDITNRVTDPNFFTADNIAKYYNMVKKSVVIPMHVKTGGLRREWDKFTVFTSNIEGYIVVERMTEETSVLVQEYQMVREYLEAMPTTKTPEQWEPAPCVCEDAKIMANYIKTSRIYIFTYYGACAYSRRMVYHAILFNLDKAMKFYFDQTGEDRIPINTDHWRYILQAYDFENEMWHEDTKKWVTECDSSIGRWELQIRGVKKWLKVSNNQGARKYAALYFQEVIDRVKEIFESAKLVHDSLDKMITLNEIIKNTLDLENGEGEEDGSDGQTHEDNTDN